MILSHLCCYQVCDFHIRLEKMYICLFSVSKHIIVQTCRNNLQGDELSCLPDFSFFLIWTLFPPLPFIVGCVWALGLFFMIHQRLYCWVDLLSLRITDDAWKTKSKSKILPSECFFFTFAWETSPNGFQHNRTFFPGVQEAFMSPERPLWSVWLMHHPHTRN